MQLSIVVPTYNENGNIQSLINLIYERLNDLEFEVIVIDDNSPDGTADAVRELQQRKHGIRLLKRTRRSGLASAIMCGAKIAQGDYVLMMDADLSHDADYVHSLIKVADEGYDVVIGSRYAAGGEIVGWPIKRRILSLGATCLSRILFGLSVKDPMSGFALFRREILRRLDGRLSLQGYKLLLEVVVKSDKLRVREVPITFRDRVLGNSKIGFTEILDFLLLCYHLKRNRTRPERIAF